MRLVLSVYGSQAAVVDVLVAVAAGAFAYSDETAH